MTPGNLFIGQRVRLTAINEADIKSLENWYADAEFARLWDATPAYPRSYTQWKKWLADAEAEKDSYMFGIRLVDEPALVGLIDLSGIQWPGGSAWLGMGIGDPAQRGQGYGTEALALTLNYAFCELNLHRVQLTVFSYNLPAIRLYEKSGFALEGAYRESLIRDGQRFDMLLYGILRHEWTGQVRR
ncbi:MAG: GNAT family N-acetyltransferase [Phototrophicaceae bacterium]